MTVHRRVRACTGRHFSVLRRCRLTACSSAGRSLQPREMGRTDKGDTSGQVSMNPKRDARLWRASLLTNMEHLDIRARDHPQPLVDGQDTIVPRIGSRADGAEDVVERGVRGKVPLHTVLLFGCISGRDEAFDDATNLADWILHREYVDVRCWTMVEGHDRRCPRSRVEDMHGRRVEAFHLLFDSQFSCA